MKYVYIIGLVFCILSCGRKSSEIEIDSVPVRKVENVQLERIDTLNPMGLFCFDKYVYLVSPQAHIGRSPYCVFDDSLRFVAHAGAWGRAANEVLEVNPYYVYKKSDAFVQCVNGYFQADVVFDGNNARFLHREKMSNHNMNNLCQVSDGNVIFEDEMFKKEWILYDMKNKKELLRFGDFPNEDTQFDFYGKYISEDEKPAFYAKAVACDTLSGDIYTLYSNIPLVKVYNKETQEVASFGIRTQEIPKDEFIRAYEDGVNPVYYNMARPYRDGVVALYHGVSFPKPYSEFHIWTKAGLSLRYSVGMWVVNFDVCGDSIYGLCLFDDCLCLFKAKFDL